jgi:hypothetical protein
MTPAPSWQTFLIGLGFGAGIILGIAALGGMFAALDRLGKRRRRRRVLRAAAKCRWCDYAGDLTEVTVHEALDHTPAGDP